MTRVCILLLIAGLAWAGLAGPARAAGATICGTVTGEPGEATDGGPIAGVQVDFLMTGGQVSAMGIISTSTNGDGHYSQVVPAGNYKAVFMKAGFQTKTVEGVTAIEGATVTVDARLKPAPSKP